MSITGGAGGIGGGPGGGGAGTIGPADEMSLWSMVLSWAPCAGGENMSPMESGLLGGVGGLAFGGGMVAFGAGIAAFGAGSVVAAPGFPKMLGLGPGGCGGGCWSSPSSLKLKGVHGEGAHGIGDGMLRSSSCGCASLGSGLKVFSFSSSVLPSSAERCEKKSTKLESCHGELLCRGCALPGFTVVTE